MCCEMYHFMNCILEDRNILECYAMSIGEWLSALLVEACSTLKRKAVRLSEMPVTISCRRDVISLKTWFFSSNSVRSSNDARLRYIELARPAANKRSILYLSCYMIWYDILLTAIGFQTCGCGPYTCTQIKKGTTLYIRKTILETRKKHRIHK